MTDASLPPDENRLHDALWALVAERGWHGFTLAELAERSGTSLAGLHEVADGKFALLRQHARAVDKAVLADAGLNTGGAPRDRLFDTLMRRIDALQPHRAGLVRFGRDMRRDPALSLALAPVLAASMQWMLEAARIESGGLQGLLRVKGLSAVWIATLRAWEQDDSQDLGPTMAALDRALDKAERAARMLRLDMGEVAGGAAPPPPVPPAAPDIVT
ncbi:TetR family transcriptional regulator [Pseudoroseomonas rhizosphaerae]|uniref:TetR family transcriptional regulator n=1 Tax=Teichococcus rhizosphaerae TaxID=1335062 RepID=A0A2C7A0D4_9PROT|nr:TetR family transcriptional regulator [Pseudoroseomonas rhizosphaerae]PHK93518.1 TetR family transcriptional regulator [Pseudoroseomonas rhizosphaerae]